MTTQEQRENDIHRVTRSMFTAEWGLVERYNPDTQRADVQLSAKVVRDGQEKKLPLLRDVPIAGFGGGISHFDTPLYDRRLAEKMNLDPDELLVLFTRTPNDGMMDDHQPSIPLSGDLATYDLDNAVVLPVRKHAVSEGGRKSHHAWTEEASLEVVKQAVVDVIENSPAGGFLNDLYESTVGAAKEAAEKAVESAVQEIKDRAADVVTDFAKQALKTAVQGTPWGAAALSAFEGISGAVQTLAEGGSLQDALLEAGKDALTGALPAPLGQFAEEITENGVAQAAKDIAEQTGIGEDITGKIDKLKETASKFEDEISAAKDLKNQAEELKSKAEDVSDKLQFAKDKVEQVGGEFAPPVNRHASRWMNPDWHQEIVQTNPKFDGRIIANVDMDSPQPWIELIENAPSGVPMAEPQNKKVNNHSHDSSSGPDTDDAPGCKSQLHEGVDWTRSVRVGRADQDPNELHPECTHNQPEGERDFGERKEREDPAKKCEDKEDKEDGKDDRFLGIF